MTTVARPATPCLDLLNSLNEAVFLPAANTKLASAGVHIATREDLDQAILIGARVNEMVARKRASQISDVTKHAHAVGPLLGLVPPSITGAEDAQFNSAIDQMPELATKFASVFA